jgi:hypothetical protein
MRGFPPAKRECWEGNRRVGTAVGPAYADKNMAEYFLYANLDRREYFLVDALGGALESSGVGRNLGARALGLLLMARGRANPPAGVEGAWAGDRILAVGDYLADGGYSKAELHAETVQAEHSDQTLFAFVEATYRDMVSAVALMLLRHDGPTELLEAANKHDDLFVVLGELALLHRHDDVARALDERVGPDWRKEYGKKRQRSAIVVPPP